jgi:hypothetical protein
VEPELHSNEKEIRSAVNQWRESVLRETERPEWFWARQRARIRSRIQEMQPSTPKLVWAAMAATFALAIAMSVPANQPQQQVVPKTPVVQAQNQISDHELMLAVERALDSGVPSSLAPAGMLAREMNEAFQQNVQTQKSSKETKYAN